MPDLPLSLPPPGQSLVFQTPVYAAMKGAPTMTGLVVAGEGHISLCTGGAGLAVKLDPDAMTALGITLIQLGNKMAADADAAATGAANALRRISREAAGNA